jgi:hypothetical protein
VWPGALSAKRLMGRRGGGAGPGILLAQAPGGQGEQWFEHVQPRLFCLHWWHLTRVKRRPSLTSCDHPPTETRLPMPSKQEWAHEARRRR